MTERERYREWRGYVREAENMTERERERVAFVERGMRSRAARAVTAVRTMRGMVYDAVNP